jgi:YidC/Oxa1 family membrane protein insertase
MFEIIIVPFINVLLFIYQILGENFGLAIIVFTILIRLVTYPLNKQQLDSAAKMQDLQKDPRWIKMQKKYKDDKEKLAQEQMKLYQELGINPFGSCLPTLIQFPIIIGLYWAVTRTMAASPIQLLSLIHDISLPNAANLLPLNNQFLWMDLSQPERLVLPILSFIPDTFPIIGQGIPVLAIVVAVTSYYQSKLMTPTNTDPNDPSASMSRSMTLMMPIMMAWLSYAYAAGLALYFFTSNIASLVQYLLMGRIQLSDLLPSRRNNK